MRKEIVYDTECFWGYWLAKFLDPETGRTRDFELYDGHPLDIQGLKKIVTGYTLVGVNNKNYDDVMLTAAIQGWPADRLKALSDHIITRNMRPWDVEREFEIKVPARLESYDLIEVAPGVMIGLKQYMARLHSKRIQDLPFAPDEVIDTLEQRLIVSTYCGNDVTGTNELRLALKGNKPEDDVIALRERVGAEWGLDLRSKSDAQMAEAVIKAAVEKKLGHRIAKPNVKRGSSFKYDPPAFLEFKTPLLQEVFATVCGLDFQINEKGVVELPKALSSRKIQIGGSAYQMGIGGLHSTEKSTTHVSTDDVTLYDRDVASYYPSLIIQCGLSPENMKGAFAPVYKDFLDQRIKAKRAGRKTEAQSFKIYLNGSFGKLGSPYSILYSPNLLIQVTMTGQLAILMLIERMEFAGISVVSANTDGVVMKCPKHLREQMLAIVAGWELATGFETEETVYAKLCSRDVNNFLAIKPDGEVKAKGAYAEPGYQKNPSDVICSEAVAAYLAHGTPIEKTVTECRDIRKFLSVQKVTGGAMQDGVPIGKVVRWYYAVGVTSDMRYIKPNKLGNHNKVPDSDGAKPLMELPDEFPTDVRFGYYIARSLRILREIGAIA